MHHGTVEVEKKFVFERGNFAFERREAVRLASRSEFEREEKFHQSLGPNAVGITQMRPRCSRSFMK